MPDVTPGGLPYPLSSEPIADGAEAIEDLAVAVDGRFLSGLRANRPAAGVLGRQYFATDTISLFLDTGASWVPVGASAGDIVATAAAAATTGWALADGAAVSRTGIYADLFAKIGTTYGVGNGSTTFNLPDLRGRVPVGADGTAGRLSANDALGNSGGSEEHTLTTAEIPGHGHDIPSAAFRRYYRENSIQAALGNGSLGGAVIEFIGQVPGGAPSTGAGAGIPYTDDFNYYEAGDFISASKDGWTNFAGGSGGHNNMQPYQVVNYLIKL